MTELEQICENALYDVIRVLEDGKSIVRDVPTGRLYFKKTLDVYNTQVFTYLRDHRSRYVPSIQAFWKEGDQLVVIEELVQGRTLEELLAITARGSDRPATTEITARGSDQPASTAGSPCDRDALDFASKISILTQICDGLDFLHSAEPPIIHRDIKASNIMVTDDGIVKIIDYDAAKIYITGQKKDTVMIGTQGLAAPEQYGFAQSDVRTDLYALGKLIERMLPDNIDAKRIADKATQMDPNKRYISAAQMKQQILRISENPSPLDKMFEKIPGFDPMNHAHRIKARIAAAALAAALILLAGFTGWRGIVYPARMTEEIATQVEAIAELEPAGGSIPDAVRKFTTAHPYQRMSAAQKKTVRDGMANAVALCFSGQNTEAAEKVRNILTEDYGDDALWQAVYEYGMADYALTVGEYDVGLAALRKCVDEGALDSAEYWEAGIALTREAALRNLEQFKANGDVTTISEIINAGMALDRYVGEAPATEAPAAPAGEPQAPTPELTDLYNEILAVAAAKRASQEFDAAVEIYAALQDALTSASGVQPEQAATHSEQAEAQLQQAAAQPQLPSAQTDLSELIAQTRYDQAQVAMDAKSYADAALLFGNLADYRDSADKYRECLYLQGLAEQESGNYKLAAEVFDEISGYKDADERSLVSKYTYCKTTCGDPTETTYAFFKALDESEYEGVDDLREEIYKWHVTFKTGMSYSFGPMQSAYVKVTLSGGPPDASTAITFRIDDPTRGEFDIWSDDEQYKSGDTVEISYSEEDSTYNLFDREYKVSVYADGDELIGVWGGRFGSDA